MKKLPILSALAFALLVVLPVPAAGQAAEKKELPAEWRDRGRADLRKNWDRLEGRPAPPIAGLKSWMQTEARGWKDLRGKVVLLDAWATWCGPCVKGIPKLQELHEKYAEKGLVVLGVHGARGNERMASFVEKRELPYAFAADLDGKLFQALKIKFIPSYFVIDRDGVMRVAGADRSKLEPIVKALLAEPASEQDSAPAPTAGSSVAKPTWPEHVKKKLYADNDLRGKSAPAFEVGEWLTEEPQREGKVVLIDFWATRCGPCRKAIPELAHLQTQFADDLVVIGISDEEPDTVRAFMEQTEMGYAQAVDPGAKMKHAVGVQGIPHVLLVDSTGVVRWQGFPFDPRDPLTADVVRSVIELDRAARDRAEGEKTARR